MWGADGVVIRKLRGILVLLEQFDVLPVVVDT